MLKDVIQNIKLKGSYYQEATMTITLGQKEKLYLLMKDAGYIIE